MKKLRLKALSLGAKEILNREQLQSIYGGFDGSGSGGSGSGGGGGPYNGWLCYCGAPFGSIQFVCHTDNSYDIECAELANNTCNGTSYACGWS